MELSRRVRLIITDHPKLYRIISPLWRKINVGGVAWVQYQFLLHKKLKEEKQLGKAPIWTSMEIETQNRCNGECSFCPVNRNIDPREYLRMSERLFQKIIDELQQINYSGRLALHSNNEPFLDKRIIQFMKYAKEHLPDAFLFVYTNGTLLSLDRFIESMKYLDGIYIYKYIDSNMWSDNVISIKKYLMDHPEFKKEVTISMRKQTEVLTSRGGAAPNKKVKDQTLPCLAVYEQVVVRPDGKLSLCCNDPLGEYTMGDLNKDSLVTIWNSKKYKKFRRMLGKSRGLVEKCKYCDVISTTK